MKFSRAVLTIAFAAGALAVPAQAEPSEYGIKSASVEVSTAQAGAHPDFTTVLELNREQGGAEQLPSTTKDLIFDLPPGLLANPAAVPRCSAAQLVTTDVNNPSNKTGCPQTSQIGVTEVHIFAGSTLLTLFEPIYNVEPRLGEPARFGFIAQIYPVLIDTELRPDREYAATARVEGASALVPLLSAASTFWGVPADESHDTERISAYEALHNNGVPDTTSGKRSAGLARIPFMLNSTRCGADQGITLTAIPYALPDLRAEVFLPLGANSGCSVLSFEPEMSIDPTTRTAETGSGLDVKVAFPVEGLKNPDIPAEALQKSVEVTLPEGMTINPSQAAGGLEVCSKKDFEDESASSLLDEGCPEASKIASVTALSPLLDEQAEGAVFLAKPYANPFGSFIALYIVVKIPERGVVVKLPAKVELDPTTGRLVTKVDSIPQLPVSSFELHFHNGARASLVTPPNCGTYKSTAVFTSWAGPENPVTLYPTFEITHGINGGPCTATGSDFSPTFAAGTINNNASSYSPSYLHLSREDGDQEMTRFSATFPRGLVAKLAGVSRCADSAIEGAKTRSGAEELAGSSCPAGSEIGHVLGGAGVGSVLTYVPGRLYLAGPYRGDPLSVVAIVPAVAGPFDVGTIVVRQALSLDPDTGEARVDGSRSDPLPHILAGIPLRVRDIRAYVDRPEFTLNPTSCDEEAFRAKLWGGGTDPFSALDDSTVSRASRFQAANCLLLGFKPRLSLKLAGGTKRGTSPALRAVLRPRPGDANLGMAQVTLPRSVFIEQAHFRTICTRVQFAAEQCPAGSIYGHVRVFSPLLDEPLEGPVYLRSSSHQLPDLVLALHGIVDIDVVARIDSVRGRLRSSFESIPDAPVSKAVLQMRGGRKSLIVNSTNLCAKANRANAQLIGQNGKAHNFSPVVGNGCRAKGNTDRKRGSG